MTEPTIIAPDKKRTTVPTRTQAHDLEFIHRVLVTISDLTDEGEIAQKTAVLLADFFGYDTSALLVPDCGGKHLTIIGLAGDRVGTFSPDYAFPVSQGIMGRVFRSGESFATDAAADDPDYYSIADWSARSEICVPLNDANRVIGIINLEHSQVLPYSVADQILLETLAGIVSSVLMNTRRNQQLEDKIKTLQAVRETALDITADLDFDTLLRRIVHRARELVHARGAEIGLLDEDQQGIRVQTSENPWYDFSGHFIPIGVGLAGQVLLTGQVVRVANYNQWPLRLNLGVPADFISAAGIPLIYKGHVIGSLVVMDDNPDRSFTDEDITILEMVARNISLAIHNAQLYRELQERSEAQRQAESRLIQSERMATAGRLTASIAHEINNPLQALHNCLYLAERVDLPQIERQKYLSMARNELDRLIITVQRMLDFYRPGVRDRQSSDVNEIIKRISELVGPHLATQNVQLITQLAPGLPKVMVVPNQIQQVILNLVLNAMEAMPGTGEVTIVTSACDSILPTKRKTRKPAHPVGVEIIVRDSGPGIPASQRDGIFEPFFSTKENGMGLGLSVSFGIIQAHGGALNLLHDDQPGACFRIALPEEKQ